MTLNECTQGWLVQGYNKRGTILKFTDGQKDEQTHISTKGEYRTPV